MSIMEKKDKPKVPVKPPHQGILKTPSVTEAARRFEEIALETIDQKPYKAYKYESNIKTSHTRNGNVEAFVVTGHQDEDEKPFE